MLVSEKLENCCWNNTAQLDDKYIKYVMKYEQLCEIFFVPVYAP